MSLPPAKPHQNRNNCKNEAPNKKFLTILGKKELTVFVKYYLNKTVPRTVFAFKQDPCKVCKIDVKCVCFSMQHGKKRDPSLNEMGTN